MHQYCQYLHNHRFLDFHVGLNSEVGEINHPMGAATDWPYHTSRETGSSDGAGSGELVLFRIRLERTMPGLVATL